VFAGPRYEGPPSDHFDGRVFTNQDPVAHGSVGRFLRWQLRRERGPWVAIPDAAPGPAPPEGVGPGRLRVTWVNHATALLQVDGLNVLTDPIWSERCSPVSWAGPRRVRVPGIRFEDLPPIDVVLVSHNHYDHCDLPTLRRLAAEHGPRFLVPLGLRALLEGEGIARVEELDWWAEAGLGDDPAVEAVCVPAQHFSNRGLTDRNATLWAGWVLRTAAGPVYFAGDTGFGRHFAQVRDRFGPPRLALLPIGAFRPRWFMAAVHVDPVEAVRAHQLLGAGTSLAIHHGTFALGDDGQTEPAEELAAALADAGVSPGRFWTLEHGEGREVPPLPGLAVEVGAGDGAAQSPGGRGSR